jgi:hypothetical protein
LEKEIKSIKKQLEDLEVQKISLEQKFIEKNFLSDEYNQATSSAPIEEKNSGSNESF